MLGSLRSNRLLWGCAGLGFLIVAAAGLWTALETSAGLDGVQTGLGFEIDFTTVPPTLLVPVTDDSMRQTRAEVTALEIAATPLGSYVRITDDTGMTFDGTLISRDANQMELMNCLTKEVVPGPHGIRQLKTSHVPLLSFARGRIAGFTALYPPAPGYAAPDLPGDWSPATIGEIVYRDGSRQRWGQPPSPRGPGDATESLEIGVLPAKFVEPPVGALSPE